MHVCKLFSLHYLSPKNFLVILFPTMSLNLPFTLIKVNYAFHTWHTLSILQIWSSGLVYICNDLPTSSEDKKLIHPTQLCHTCHLVHKVYMILLSLKWHYKGQNGNPLQCSCLENPRDGGAWWAAVCGVTQSPTRLKQLSSSSSSSLSLHSLFLLLLQPLL